PDADRSDDADAGHRHAATLRRGCHGPALQLTRWSGDRALLESVPYELHDVLDGRQVAEPLLEVFEAEPQLVDEDDCDLEQREQVELELLAEGRLVADALDGDPRHVEDDLLHTIANHPGIAVSAHGWSPFEVAARAHRARSLQLAPPQHPPRRLALHRA